MAETLEKLVSEEDIRTFHEDGAVCLRNVLSREWLDLVAHGFEQAVASPGVFSKATVRKAPPDTIPITGCSTDLTRSIDFFSKARWRRFRQKFSALRGSIFTMSIY